MALAFVNSPAVPDLDIIGATTMEQLRTDIGSVDVTISPELEAGIDAIHQLHLNSLPLIGERPPLFRGGRCPALRREFGTLDGK